MAGRVEYAYVPAVSGMGPIKDGKVKALAVSTSKRVAALPDVPTLGEAGFAQGESTFWLALLAPAKTPPEVIAKVNAEVSRALKTPEIVERLAKLGTEPMFMTPAEADAFIQREYQEPAKSCATRAWPRNSLQVTAALVEEARDPFRLETLELADPGRTSSSCAWSRPPASARPMFTAATTTSGFRFPVYSGTRAPE